MSLKNLKQSLEVNKNAEHAKNLSWFFKTGKGQYGYGDIFIGIKVPVLRTIVKNNLDLSLKEIQSLLDSKIHEERLVALLILVELFKKSNDINQEKIYKFYLKNTKRINNWDLVDLSCHKILGKYLIDKNKDILFELAKSDNLWERRISMISTLYFINNFIYDTSLDIALILLKDSHDLIHKAVGWMLREIGKRDYNTEYNFLVQHYKKMPRTMLRYAIEKFPEKIRKSFLHGEI